MRVAVLLVLALAYVQHAFSQETSETPEYTQLTIKRFSVLKGSLSGEVKIHRITDMLELRFMTEDEERFISMSADLAEFSYAEDSEEPYPSLIRLTGNVSVDNGEGQVTSQQAVVDFDAGLATFTGSPKMDTERIQGMKAEEISLNLETGDFKILKGSIAKLVFQKPEEVHAWDSLLFKDEDMRWPEFLPRLQADARAPEMNPGKHLVQLLGKDMERAFVQADIDSLISQKATLLERINDLLVLPEFYSAALWQGRTLSAGATALIRRGTTGLSDLERVWLNRSLLAAAYPNRVKPPPPLSEIRQ